MILRVVKVEAKGVAQTHTVAKQQIHTCKMTEPTLQTPAKAHKRQRRILDSTKENLESVAGRILYQYGNSHLDFSLNIFDDSFLLHRS